MAVREKPDEDELEGIALPDDGSFDLVEDVSGELVNALELH